MYSISDLERISDVKAHTIRIWEKRYALFNPQRTKGNHRLYGDDDLLRLLNVNRMVKAGNRVSIVSRWEDKEMANQIAKLETSSNVLVSDKSYYLDEILAAAMAYNESRFLHVFDIIDSKHRFEVVWYDYLVPVLQRIGDLWTSKKISPAQEHFLSHLIERKLGKKIDDLPDPNQSAKEFLLFLPVAEMHELGLLMCQFCIKQAGFKVIYLGGNVPILNIESYQNEHKPRVLLTYVNGMKLSKQFVKFLNKSEMLSCDLVLAGRLNDDDKKEIMINEKIILIDTLDGLKSYLSQLISVSA